MTASNYAQPRPVVREDSGARGRVAMYAWGEDYHDVIRDRLRMLVERLRHELTEPFDSRVCVDTVPIIERELAAAAGIGWIGKNTLVLNEEQGSYFFLGAVVTTLELAHDEAVVDHCGTCRACLDACPTNAFPAPYELDASKCISYLTIEHRGEIDEAFHDSMDGWVFGCDVCQDVCPHNRRAPATTESRFAARASVASPLLSDLMAWTEDDYDRALRDSAMKRAKLDMLKRNARIAMDRATDVPPE
jgi:epoxyqueuosine reductase